VRGVVDSEGLSLNVSREILQQDRQIRAIRSFLVKKVLETLKGMLESQKEKYIGFWKEFGPFLKQGLYSLEEKDRKESILNLVLAESSHADGLTTLAEYVQRMKTDQQSIFYMTGSSRETVERSPHLEAFRSKGYEVLYLTDPVDELWTTAGLEYQGKKFQSVSKGEVELGTTEEKKKAEEERQQKEKDFKAVLDGLLTALSDEVKEVRLSSRLVSSPACLVSAEGDFSPQIDELMKRMGHKVEKKKRVLELNPEHELLAKLQQRYQLDPQSDELKGYARLLYGQALLAEGSQLPDGADYGRLIVDLMNRAL